MALKIWISESETVQRHVQEETKVVRGFGGEEIKDCETKSMATLRHRHRKKFIQK